jgi:hypothetical protein
MKPFQKQTPDEWLRTHRATQCPPSWEFDVRVTNTTPPRRPGRPKRRRGRPKHRRHIRKSVQQILTERHVLIPEEEVELYQRELMFERLHRPAPRQLPLQLFFNAHVRPVENSIFARHNC